MITYVAGSDRPLSYGGVKGSLAGDWPGLLDDSSPDHLAEQLAAAGFCALEVIDDVVLTAGQKRVAAALPRVLGGPVTRDAVNHRTYYDLRGTLQALRARTGDAGVAAVRAGALQPVRADLDPGTSQLRGRPGAELFETTAARTSLRVANPAPGPRHVNVTFQVRSAVQTTVRVGEQVLQVGSGAERVSLTLDLAAGDAMQVPISTDSPGQVLAGRTAYLQVSDIALTYDRGPL